MTCHTHTHNTQLLQCKDTHRRETRWRFQNSMKNSAPLFVLIRSRTLLLGSATFLRCCNLGFTLEFHWKLFPGIERKIWQFALRLYLGNTKGTMQRRILNRRIRNRLYHITPVSQLHFQYEANEQRILAQRPLVRLVKLYGVFMASHLSQDINERGRQRVMLLVRSWCGRPARREEPEASCN